TTAKMTFFAVPQKLDKFPTIDTPRGLKVTVRKDRGATVLPSTFQANIKGPKSFVRTRALTPTVKQYVTRPSARPVYRGPQGQELPINRLWADPDSQIVERQLQAIVNPSTEVVERK